MEISNGQVVELDLNRVTVREYRAMFDASQPQAEEDATLAKAYGMTVEQITELSLVDYKRLAREFFDAARNPLADPN